MAYATFEGIEIPKIYDITVDYVSLSDKSRTAGGKLRKDTLGLPKRVWTLQCRPVPKHEVEPLLNHLRSTFFAEGAFLLHGWSEPVIAQISEEIQLKIVTVADEQGNWHKDGIQMTLTVEEV
jgi:hypothetical protein